MKQVQTKNRKIFITINVDENEYTIDLSKKFVEEIKDKFPTCKVNFFVAAIESDPEEPRPDPLNA